MNRLERQDRLAKQERKWLEYQARLVLVHTVEMASYIGRENVTRSVEAVVLNIINEVVDTCTMKEDRLAIVQSKKDAIRAKNKLRQQTRDTAEKVACLPKQVFS